MSQDRIYKFPAENVLVTHLACSQQDSTRICLHKILCGKKQEWQEHPA